MSQALRSFGVGLTLSVFASAASAQIFASADIGGGLGGPRVNSDAAHAGWLAAAGPLAHTESFEGIALGSTAPLALGGGMTLLTAGAAAPTAAPLSLNTVTDVQDGELGYDTTLDGERFYRFSPTFGGSATLTITFASPITAFGVYLTGVQHFAGQTTASWGGTTFTLLDTDPLTTRAAGVQFFGFVSPVPVSSVEFRTRPHTMGGRRDIIGFDDIQIAVSTVPEPSSTSLLFGALLALGAAGRIRRRT